MKSIYYTTILLLNFSKGLYGTETSHRISLYQSSLYQRIQRDGISGLYDSSRGGWSIRGIKSLLAHSSDEITRTIANVEAHKLIPQYKKKIHLLEDPKELHAYKEVLSKNIKKFVNEYGGDGQHDYYEIIGFNLTECLKDMKTYHKIHWYRADLMKAYQDNGEGSDRIDTILDEIFQPFIDNVRKRAGLQKTMLIPSPLFITSVAIISVLLLSNISQAIPS